MGRQKRLENKQWQSQQFHLFTLLQLFKVVDSKATFIRQNHNNAMIALKKSSEKKKEKIQSAQARQKQDTNEYNRLINMLKGL
jgi:superfamily II RNA helicase